MTRFKDFGATTSAAEPLSFQLNGETFDCLPEIQGKVLLDLVKDSSSEDAAKSAEIITNFFSFVLTNESEERFNAMLSSKDKIVSVETLAEITGWLVQEYTNRPEGQPEVS